jgi:MFS family permease
MITIFVPALRLIVQNIGVQAGSGFGIIIIQCSQVITVLGGPAGYLLACNSFAAEVVEPSERTATLGRLTGCSLFGTSAGFLLGGLISDSYGIIAPFRVAVVLFMASVAYAAFFLPHVPLNKEIEAKASASLKTFFDPLKIFVPQKWRLPNGKVQREYGTMLVGIGVFLGIFATGYIPVLLQMYSTDAFGFTPNENGWLISLNCLVRGLFLTLAFPAIISRGRKWKDSRLKPEQSAPRRHSKDIDYLPSTLAELASVPGGSPSTFDGNGDVCFRSVLHQVLACRRRYPDGLCNLDKQRLADVFGGCCYPFGGGRGFFCKGNDPTDV